MTKARKKKVIKNAKRASSWKAPNKRKHVVMAASKPVVTPATVISEAPRMPFVFWPLEVMKWWMPSSARTGT